LQLAISIQQLEIDKYNNYDKLSKLNRNLKKFDIVSINCSLNKSTKKGDSILVKGSRCWQLEKIIELIN